MRSYRIIYAIEKSKEQEWLRKKDRMYTEETMNYVIRQKKL
jgi:hypothetical protein